MSKRWLSYTALAFPLLAFSVLRAEPKPPAATPACPDAVKGAIARAFPKSTVTTCKAEHEHGHDQFEVKLVKADGAKAEVDLAADGTVLQIEEKIPIDKVPAAVMKAFAARYPNAKVDAAEKQVPTGGTPRYELAYAAKDGRKEATFTEAGKFIEEE